MDKIVLSKDVYQRTEIGKIPRDWEVKKINEIAEVNKENLSGNTPAEYEFYYYDLSSVDKGKVLHPTEKLKFADAPSRAKRLFKRNDVLMSTVRPNLQGFTYVDFDSTNSVCSTGFAVIAGKYESDSMYIYQNLFSYGITRQIKKLLVGSNYPAINSKDVENLKVPFPNDKKEREKIASILSTWDKAIELKEKLIEQKKEQKKGLMQKLLTGEVRLPGFDGEWQEYEVQEICSLGRGRVISKKEIAKNIGTYPVYSSQTSDEGKIGSINTYDFDGEYITWTTDGANAGTVFYRNGKFNCTNVCGILKLNKDNIDARYLSYILQANTEKYVVRHGNPKLMNNIMAIIPVRIFNNYNYQKYICDLFDVLDKEIKLFEKEVKEIKHQKQGLMQLLLTGKIRVQV